MLLSNTLRSLESTHNIYYGITQIIHLISQNFELYNYSAISIELNELHFLLGNLKVKTIRLDEYFFIAHIDNNYYYCP